MVSIHVVYLVYGLCGKKNQIHVPASCLMLHHPNAFQPREDTEGYVDFAPLISLSTAIIIYPTVTIIFHGSVWKEKERSQKGAVEILDFCEHSGTLLSISVIRFGCYMLKGHLNTCASAKQSSTEVMSEGILY